MKTPMSRFHIHDELTAPEGSVPVLRGALATGGQLPNFLGVLAGSPAALRGYARFRSELRHGTLTLPTLERIALAVAEHYHSEPGMAMHSRTARQAGLGARRGRARPRVGLPRRARGDAACATSRRSSRARRKPPMHLHEEAREAGWTDEQILEAIAATALETFTAMVNVAGEVPVDGSWRTRGRSRRRDRRRAAAVRLNAMSPEAQVAGDGPRVPGQAGHLPPTCCPLLPRSGRADRPPLDGRDRRGPARPRPAALQRDRPGGPRAQRPPALRADEGARGPRRRRRATSTPARPVKVIYELTDMGRSLEPALPELKSWARRWLRGRRGAPPPSPRARCTARAADRSPTRSAPPPRPPARGARSRPRAS